MHHAQGHCHGDKFTCQGSGRVSLSLSFQIDFCKPFRTSTETFTSAVPCVLGCPILVSSRGFFKLHIRFKNSSLKLTYFKKSIATQALLPNITQNPLLIFCSRFLSLSFANSIIWTHTSSTSRYWIFQLVYVVRKRMFEYVRTWSDTYCMFEL